MTETEKMQAYIWAAKVHPKAVPVLSLSKGEMFVWPVPGKDWGNNYMVYRGRGWYCYHDSVGDKRCRCYRIGVKTAVIQVKE